jgi:hypothetical protein
MRPCASLARLAGGRKAAWAGTRRTAPGSRKAPALAIGVHPQCSWFPARPTAIGFYFPVQNPIQFSRRQPTRHRAGASAVPSYCSLIRPAGATRQAVSADVTALSNQFGQAGADSCASAPPNRGVGHTESIADCREIMTPRSSKQSRITSIRFRRSNHGEIALRTLDFNTRRPE